MTGIALVHDGKGSWNCYAVTGEATIVSPVWNREIKATTQETIEEFDAKIGRKVKKKALVTRVVGKHEVKGESLAVAMNRARQWLAESVRKEMKPTAKVAL